MRTFKHFPTEAICPICGTNKDSETFLAPIDGTQEDNIAEAQCVHVECVVENLKLNRELKMIYFKINLDTQPKI